MTDAQALARVIQTQLGGPNNIIEVENCMTRLRVQVANPETVDTAALRHQDGVLAVNEQGDNFQIVLGPGLVDRVAKQMDALINQPKTSLKERSAQVHAKTRAKHDTATSRLLRKISAIFVPLIPALIACGLIAGVNGILANLVTSKTALWLAPATALITPISAGFFAALPIFVAYNAAKEFNGTPILGGVIGGLIVSATIAKVSIFTITLVPGQGGVLGALAGGILIAYAERWIRSWCPDVLAVIVVPLLAVLVVGLLQILIIMTVAGWIAAAIGSGVTWLLTQGGAVAGFVMGGLFLPVVMTGMHQALTPIHTTLISQTGVTVLLPVLAMAGAGQIGAVLALWTRFRKNKTFTRDLKGALPAGFLGIGEPLIYGITLPLGRPFITACVGGAFGGMTVGLFDQLGITSGAVAIGVSDLSLIPLLNGSKGIGLAIMVYCLGLLVAYVTGFLATRFFGISPAVIEEVALSFPEQDDPSTSDATVGARVKG